MTLKQFIKWDAASLTAQRGAISRVAEHLDVTWTTVFKWCKGEWKPGMEMRRKIQDMIHQRVNIGARHRSRSR